MSIMRERFPFCRVPHPFGGVIVKEILARNRGWGESRYQQAAQAFGRLGRPKKDRTRLRDGSGLAKGSIFRKQVGKAGVEPARPRAHDPKSCSSASSDTSPEAKNRFTAQIITKPLPESNGLSRLNVSCVPGLNLRPVLPALRP